MLTNLGDFADGDLWQPRPGRDTLGISPTSRGPVRTSATLWLLLLVGCGRPAVPDPASDTSNARPAAITDAQRQATEDSVEAWLTTAEKLLEQGDSAGIMAMYVATGVLVSAGDGKLMTTRDSVASMYAGLGQVKGAKVTMDDPKIDVLAPGVAAVTVPFGFEGTNQGQAFDNRSVYSAVLAERDGRMRIIQEHSSTAPPSPKK